VSIILYPRDLSAALDKVIHAAASDRGRPILNGIHFLGDESGLRLQAADNYRMAEARVTDEDASEFGSAVVPLDDIAGIRWLMKGYTKPTSTIPMALGRGTAENGAPQPVTVTLSFRTLTLRVIDGKYPRFDTLWEQEAGRKRSSVKVNPKYLADTGKAVQKWETGVTVAFAGPLDTILVTEDGYRELIMPIRVVPDETPRDKVEAEDAVVNAEKQERTDASFPKESK
jgi:hypothetical protein